MSRVIHVGVSSSSNSSRRALTIWGNILQSTGEGNPNGTSFISVGSIEDYHRHRTWSGLQGGFAAIADHGHNEIVVSNVSTPLDLRTSSHLYTTGATWSTHLGCVFGRGAVGTAVANEVSIDTRNTVVSGTFSNGVVVLNFSGTSTGMTVGQRAILEISGVMVAGIEAANYPGIITVVDTTTTPGSTAVSIDISGLDANHWTDSAKGLVTSQNGNWALLPLAAAVSNVTSVASVSGDTAVDVTFSSVPSDVVVGRQVSLWVTSASTLTGLAPDTLIPGSVVSITGSVARVRLRNVRNRNYFTIAGSDSTTSRFALYIGVGDPFHEPTMGGISWSVIRNANGVVTNAIFGPNDVANNLTNAVAVGIGIVTRASNTFRFGTSDSSNAAELVGNRLTASGGFSTGTARWTSGTGSPEGVVTAPVGSLYTRTDGGANTTLYVKESGTGNTGWIAK